MSDENAIEPITEYHVEMPDGIFKTNDYDEYIKKLQEIGVLQADQEAPKCLNCNTPLSHIWIDSIWIANDRVLEHEDYQWSPGLQQYVVDPATFEYVNEGLTRLKITCYVCGASVPDLHPIPGSRSHRHGMIYGTDIQVANAL